MPEEWSIADELKGSSGIGEEHPNEAEAGVSVVGVGGGQKKQDTGKTAASDDATGNHPVLLPLEQQPSSAPSGAKGTVKEVTEAASHTRKPTVIGAPQATCAQAMSIGERQPARRPQLKAESACEGAGQSMPAPSQHQLPLNGSQSSNTGPSAGAGAGSGEPQPAGSSSGSGNCCAGCRQPIRDKFIFSVIDLHWHQDCVQCCVCAGKLDERCYALNGKLYCKLDYWRRFGPKCFACRESIERSELVQRIKGNRVYHLKCFTCTDCRKQLKAGQMFHLLEGNRLLCKDDFNSANASLLSSGKRAPQHQSQAHDSARQPANQDKSNGPPFGGPFDGHHQIFYTLTSSSGSGSSKQQLGGQARAAKLAAGPHAGLSGGEEELAEEEELDELDGCEGEEEEMEEMEEEAEEEDGDLEGSVVGGQFGDTIGAGRPPHEDSDAAESLDGMRRLLASYHPERANSAGHLRCHENDENHACYPHATAGQHHQLDQADPKRRANRQQLSANAPSSNARRKRRRKRGAPQAEAALKKLASGRNGESILHGITGASSNHGINNNNNTGSILAAAQCATTGPIHSHSHNSTTSTTNSQQAPQQKCSSFSSPASTASNCSVNSSSSLHNQHAAAGLAHLASSASGGQQHQPATNGPSQQQQQQQQPGAAHKPTRVRTVLNERQLQTLRDVYASNPRPDALLKEQLVDMTGLSPRVIRVWFQNKRCKDKKKSILYKQMQQHEKEGRHLAGLSMARGLPMVAGSPIQYDDQSSVSSTPAGGPQAPDANHQLAVSPHSQSQALDIHAYQPPWKSLVEYAHQQQQTAAAPAPTSACDPTNRLNASSPRYQQLMGKIHGYMGDLADQDSLTHHRQHLRLPEQVAPPQQQPPTSYHQPSIHQHLHHNHLNTLTSQQQHGQQHQQLHQLAPPSAAQAPLMNHLHQF